MGTYISATKNTIGTGGSQSWSRYWATLFKDRPNNALDYYSAGHAANFLELPGTGGYNYASIHGYVIDFLSEYGLSSWNGYRYWMSHTPYNEPYENPTIICSNDGLTWVEPAGISNPIEPTPGGSLYNADSALYFDKTNNVLYCTFRQDNTYIYEKHSSDGINWTDKVAIYYLSDTMDMVSPNLLKAGSDIYLYGTKGENNGIQRRKKLSTWSFDDTEDIVLDTTGCVLSELQGYISPLTFFPWHQEVRYWNQHYFMLLFYHTSATYTSANYLFFAHSSDGINFKVSKYPIMSKYYDINLASSTGDFSWDMAFYKSSFVPYFENNILKFRLWYVGDSQQTGAYQWHCGYSDLLLSDVGLSFSDSENTANSTYLSELAKAVALNGYTFGDDCNREDASVINPSACGLNYTLGTSAVFNIKDNFIINARGGVPPTGASELELAVPLNFELKYQMINATVLTGTTDNYPHLFLKYISANNEIIFGEGKKYSKDLFAVYASTTKEIMRCYRFWKKDELIEYHIIFNGASLKIYANGVELINHIFVLADFKDQATMDAALAATKIRWTFPSGNNNDKIKNIMIKSIS